MANEFGGVFMGTTMLQSNMTLGGARSVFVKLRGEKNELVFPTHGGQLQNPFKGAAKIFAGDLMEYRTDSDGQNPSVYLLKTFKVKSASGTDIVLYKDGFKHVPFVGDILMKAPSAITGTGAAYAVTSVSVNSDGNWAITVATTLGSLADGDILVEAAESGAAASMLVQNINAVAACDYDCFYTPSAGDSDWDGARYLIAPALGGLMYTSKMSPIPDCVAALNTCKVNGWFKVEL